LHGCLAESAGPFLEKIGADAGGQGIDSLARMKTSNGTKDLPLAGTLQNSIQSCRSCREKKDALASLGSLADDLGCHPRLAGARKPLDQAHIWTGQGPADSLALGIIERFVEKADRAGAGHGDQVASLPCDKCR
jgi:hypothetical protein